MSGKPEALYLVLISLSLVVPGCKREKPPGRVVSETFIVKLGAPGRRVNPDYITFNRDMRRDRKSWLERISFGNSFFRV